MALFIRQDDNRSKLQERLVAELQEKAKKSAAAGEMPDMVRDSKMLEDTKVTTSMAWLWILIIFAAIGVVVWVSVASSS